MPLLTFFDLLVVVLVVVDTLLSPSSLHWKTRASGCVEEQQKHWDLRIGVQAEPLLEALYDESHRVRKAAADALVKMGSGTFAELLG